MNVAAVALSCALAFQPAAPPEPDSEAVEASTADEPAVSDTVLKSVEGKRVTAVVAGVEYSGTLTTVAEETIVLAEEDGTLRELDKGSVESIKLAEATPEPAPPSPAPGPDVTVGCVGDASCEDPRRCIEGQCRIEKAYVDDLEEEGRSRYRSGQIVLGIGASLLIVGAILMPAGYIAANKVDDANASNFENFEEQEAKAHRLFAMAYAGTAMFGVGAVLSVVGGILYGLGKNKLRRVKHYRTLDLAGGPTRGGLTLELRGHF